MSEEVQELKNELRVLIALKNIYTAEEYMRKKDLWNKKWVKLALKLTCSPGENTNNKKNNDLGTFTIGLN